MKNFTSLILLVFLANQLFAQVEKTILVEHFTNSRCGLCASKNPGLFLNLEAHPEVMHVSFHPSSPYPACIFSQHNVMENDDRTKYYSIFGGTPWIVINGEVQSSGTNFSNPVLFDPFFGQTSPFDFNITEYRNGDDDIQVEVTINAVSSHTVNVAALFVGFVEDTVFYAAPNGEDIHPNVFRKAMTDIEGDPVMMPMVGDSITLYFEISPNDEWVLDRMYSLAILQDPVTKEIHQAGKTSAIMPGGPSFIGQNHTIQETLSIYPNPAGNQVFIEDAQGDIYIYASGGQAVGKITPAGKERVRIDLSEYPTGIYYIRSENRSAMLSVVK